MRLCLYILYPLQHSHPLLNWLYNHCKKLLFLLGNLTSTSRTFDNCKTFKITETKTKWYIILVTLISGIIVGIFITSLFFLRYRQRWVNKKQKQLSTNAEGRVNTVDSTYQELDLLKMNEEDNYQSLRPEDDTADKTYQELDLSKRNIEDNNYESLQKNNESEYVIADK